MDTIRFIRTLLAISMCTGLALASTVLAAPVGTDMVAAKIKAMDTNRDGLVSASEHAVYARSQFDAMDTNHDGQVTAAEMDASRMAKMKLKTTVGLQPASVTIIKPMDSNNDGMVSAEEHARDAEKDFNGMDADHDGQLSADEMRIGHDMQGSPAAGMN